MPFGIIASLIGAGASIFGSLNASNASQQAAQTQANAAGQANQITQQMFDTTQANLSPFLQAGTNALPILQKQMGIGPGGQFNPNAPLVQPFTQAQFQSSPGYAFQQQQGIDAIQNSAAARGGVVSGNTLKDLQTFGTGLANQDWWNAYNAYTQNQQRQFGNLNTIVGSGQNAGAQLGAFSGSTAGQLGGNLIGAGNALAAGTVGSVNAITGGVNSLAQQAFLQQILAQNNPGGSGSYSGFPAALTAGQFNALGAQPNIFNAP